MPATQRKLLVVEDEHLIASLLGSVLNGAGFETRLANDAKSARELAREFDPDVFLLDINLGDGPSGIDLARVFNKTNPGAAIIFLTRHTDLRVSGLSSQDLPLNTGFLRKDKVADSNYLLSAIESVISGDNLERHDLETTNPLKGLTKKQLEVLGLAAEGKSNSAIAQELGTSERAVDFKLKAIYDTLQLSNNPSINRRVEAVRLFLQPGNSSS